MIPLLLAISLRLTPNAPSLDVFGSGPLTNLGSEQADTNALAHVWFGIACPLAGYYAGGRRGLRIAAGACAGLILIRQTFFHGATPGPETRTDLLSGLLPILAVVAADALVNR